MRKSQSVDTMPEFESLVVRSANLMLAANSHQAKGELFEAGVAWVKAGRARAELGSRLLHNGYVYEAAQELLHAAACFLEAGDYRPAQEQLERFTEIPELRNELESNGHLAAEHERITQWSDDRRATFEHACQGAWGQIQGDVTRHDRLRVAWLDRTLRQLPGVPEIHWFATEKYWIESKVARSIEHNWWCIHLRPGYSPYRIVLLSRLIEARLWKEAITTGEESVELFPDDPFILWLAGWARVQRVLVARGAKALLDDAKALLERALQLGKRTSEVLAIGATCALAACVNRMGDQKEAGKLLEELVQEYPAAATDLAWRMLHARGTDREKLLSQNGTRLTQRVWRNTGYEPSILADAA